MTENVDPTSSSTEAVDKIKATDNDDQKPTYNWDDEVVEENLMENEEEVTTTDLSSDIPSNSADPYHSLLELNPTEMESRIYSRDAMISIRQNSKSECLILDQLDELRLLGFKEYEKRRQRGARGSGANRVTEPRPSYVVLPADANIPPAQPIPTDLIALTYDRDFILSVRENPGPCTVSDKKLEKLKLLREDRKKKLGKPWRLIRQKMVEERLANPDEEIFSQILCRLNKLTLNNKNQLIPEISAYNIHENPAFASRIIQFLLKKCVTDSKISGVYVELCELLVDNERASNPSAVTSQIRTEFIVGVRTLFLNRVYMEEYWHRAVLTFIGNVYKSRMFNLTVLRHCIRETIQESFQDGYLDQTRVSRAIFLIDKTGYLSEEVFEEEVWSHWFLVISYRIQELSPANRRDFKDLVDLKNRNWFPRKPFSKGPFNVDDLRREVEEEKRRNEEMEAVESARGRVNRITLVVNDEQPVPRDRVQRIVEQEPPRRTTQFRFGRQ